MGLAGADDAGVIKVSDDLALVQSVDFFTPIVDAARTWGRIAAANALSDIYAMGGTPFTALQLLSWPRDTLSWELASDVIDGGLEVLDEASCTLVGGHSIDDREPKFGYAVTGTVAPDRIMTKDAAVPGDVLVITKPIGTGVITTALKAGAAPSEVVAAATAVMTTLNRAAAQAALAAGVTAATDITGYGLLGHLREVADASKVTAVVETGAVPVIPGAGELAEAGHFPGGSKRNLRSLQGVMDTGSVSDATVALLADAQTSGGLLLCVRPDRVEGLTAALDGAVVIGEIADRSNDTNIILR